MAYSTYEEGLASPRDVYKEKIAAEVAAITKTVSDQNTNIDILEQVIDGLYVKLEAVLGVDARVEGKDVISDNYGTSELCYRLSEQNKRTRLAINRISDLIHRLEV